MKINTLHEKEANALATTQLANEIINSLNSENIEFVEAEFSELLKQIPDADLRERIDRAVGRISFAYEKLGFIAGYLMERTLN